MICIICKTNKYPIRSRSICSSCAKKIWEKERLPILIKQGHYGYCEWCKKPKKLPHVKFCSLKCSGEFQKSKRPEGYRVCRNCGKEFHTNPAYIKRRKNAGIFCSKKCFHEYQFSHPHPNTEKSTQIKIDSIGGKEKILIGKKLHIKKRSLSR